MDTRGRTGGSKPEASSRAVWRIRLGWVHATASLAMIASALSGCASHLVEHAIGRDPRLYPPVVDRYEWTGRRGDELVVVYRVWGGHPLARAGRVTRLGGRNVLRLTTNPATESLYERIAHRLDA